VHASAALLRWSRRQGQPHVAAGHRRGGHAGHGHGVMVRTSKLAGALLLICSDELAEITAQIPTSMYI
jgi:hypothetical protein